MTKTMTAYGWETFNGFIAPKDLGGKETTYTIAHLAFMTVEEEKRTGKKSEILQNGLYR